jgi:hypothetical protein
VRAVPANQHRAAPIAGHDVKIIRSRPDGHAGGLQIVPLIPARQDNLADGNSVPVEAQNAPWPYIATYRLPLASARIESGLVGAWRRLEHARGSRRRDNSCLSAFIAQ